MGRFRASMVRGAIAGAVGFAILASAGTVAAANWLGVLTSYITNSTSIAKGLEEIAEAIKNTTRSVLEFVDTLANRRQKGQLERLSGQLGTIIGQKKELVVLLDQYPANPSIEKWSKIANVFQNTRRNLDFALQELAMGGRFNTSKVQEDLQVILREKLALLPESLDPGLQRNPTTTEELKALKQLRDTLDTEAGKLSDVRSALNEFVEQKMKFPVSD